MGPIVGILLAAGASRRFGSDKLTQSLPDGDLVAVRACRNLLAGTDSVLAVVRPGSERLAALLQAEGADVLICANAGQGMSASLVSGVRARPEAAGWLIALADMPWIAPTTIFKVAEALRMGANDCSTPLARPARSPGRLCTHFRPGTGRVERR